MVLKIQWHVTGNVIKPLKLSLVSVILEKSVRTSKRTPHSAVTKISLLMPFK
jgi:hypothetical protein